jgi:hypothetical protein
MRPALDLKSARSQTVPKQRNFIGLVIPTNVGIAFGALPVAVPTCVGTTGILRISGCVRRARRECTVSQPSFAPIAVTEK